MKRMNLWVMRHGEKDGDGDKLTEKGVEQVKRSALMFKGITFQAAFYSGMDRAKETVEVALEALGQPHLQPKSDEGFGYVWAEKEQPLTPEIRKAATEEKEEVTAADWLKAWPGALLIRGRFLATMLGWARTLANRFPAEEEIDVLVGSHSPTGELAALKPESTRALGLAEVICYVVEYDEQTDGAKLVGSARLRSW